MYSNKIDMHAHFLPPSYMEYMKKYEDAHPDNFDTPDWSEEAHIKLMDSMGAAYSLISISSPNLSNASDEIEKEYVRKVNEEGAAFAAKYLKRVGLMAELPLPNAENSLEETKYALDTLKAVGFGLKTNYRGKYLGCTDFDPVMELLNNRKAVVVIHPTKPYKLYEGVNEGLPLPVFEYFVETTRTFINMVLTNTFVRYPDIRWVFPHAGAFISLISDRVDACWSILLKTNPGLETDFFEAMKHVYFDLAGFPLPKQIQILKQNVPVENMLYGSDCPYTPGYISIGLAGVLEETDQFTEKEKEMIFTGNALRLLPQVGVTDTDSATPKVDSKRDVPRARISRRLMASFYRHFVEKKV